VGFGLKGYDCVPKQIWNSKDEFVVGDLGVHSFFLFNLLGFKQWGIMAMFIL